MSKPFEEQMDYGRVHHIFQWCWCLLLAPALLVGCGSRQTHASAIACTVYAVYRTDIRYAVGTPAQQVKGQLLLTKANVDPSRVQLTSIPPDAGMMNQQWYFVRVGYTGQAVQQANHRLPNAGAQIIVTWTFEGSVIQSGYQVGASPFDQLGPFHSRAAAQHFSRVLTTNT